ncbi:hypothetical protein Kpol_1050p102 [Vanderwaltozyma polyspora DSM 70294]|uniref:Uncharacterized protein n=1 Tax=Vanderwaltozyma polyspora (strain ATCC 22028 / DSM 70294 / BCRC 21397 / CBS 2163 / NBRC 10782 / NRRL Y-8283 / UCD 57-17) TaxID=436907 RepID=A7TEZ6_VANPO|nr:uncharacterized protein Kpol_1050p102 [Vanderwaltozyma polyspora DSM 70294]EDO19242.1 hypothetical protein Kpol_1050p102 [Vanderwaltozyma polyspora DSM 70294]
MHIQLLFSTGIYNNCYSLSLSFSASLSLSVATLDLNRPHKIDCNPTTLSLSESATATASASASASATIPIAIAILIYIYICICICILVYIYIYRFLLCFPSLLFLFPILHLPSTPPLLPLQDWRSNNSFTSITYLYSSSLLHCRFWFALVWFGLIHFKLLFLSLLATSIHILRIIISFQFHPNLNSKLKSQGHNAHTQLGYPS